MENMKINELMEQTGSDIYYDDDFHVVLENHLSYLRNHPSTQEIAIDEIQSHRFEFDFYGLCAHYNVRATMRWIVMRINGFTAPTQADRKIRALLIPDESVVDRIKQSHRPVRRIN